MARTKPCDASGCERGTYKSAPYCSKHKRQFEKYGEVWPLGDKAKANEHKRRAWERLSDEEKAARLAPMIDSVKGKPRSAQHSRRISESLRARWAESPYEFAPRACRGCEGEFAPNSASHWYCDKQCQDARSRLRGHGLTNRQYLDMLAAQGGVCDLCKTAGRGPVLRYGLVVDHCHDTGKVRGLLCVDCNTALGRFGDDAARLRAAADYIDRTCPH